MSSDAFPITPARFATAIKDLPLASLHLKVLELRNSIAHLDYSNEQLRPYAEGREQPLSSSSGARALEPDQDCVDAIRENEEVISRMQERIRLVRVEVEGRGGSWTEFQSKEEAEAEADGGEQAGLGNGVVANGVHDHDDENGEQRHRAWGDGTFQTGTIRNGEVRMDEVAGARGQQQGQQGQQGGRLTDEELRRMLEERLGPDQEDDEDEEGMHL